MFQIFHSLIPSIFLLYFRQMLIDERLAVVENRAVNINQASIVNNVGIFLAGIYSIGLH